VKKVAVILLALICLTIQALCAESDYKQVLILTNGESIRIRLPLTDVTGKFA